MGKNSIQAVIVITINILICLLFFQYSGINYNPGGVAGEASILSLILSIVYIILLLGVAFFAGLFNLQGIIWGLFGLCAVIIALFYIGSLGIGSLIAILIIPMYFFVAPFAPIVDVLSYLTNPSYVNYKAIIYIPIFCYLISLFTYYLGYKIRANKTHT